MRFFILFFTIATLTTSCGNVRVFVNEDSTFSRKNPITIDQDADDASGTLGELQFLLKSSGYKLMSYGAAKKALNFDENGDRNSSHSEVTSTTEFNSAYIIDLKYTGSSDIGVRYKSFSATITDLRSGEIIMTAVFRGDKAVKKVLKEFVMQINKVIK